MTRGKITDGLTRRALVTRAGRSFAAVAGVGVGATLLQACGSDDGPATTGSGASTGSSSSKTVVYAGFGGQYEQIMKDAIFTPFTKATGIEVVTTAGAVEIPKLMEQVKAGRVEWDVLDGDTSLVSARIGLGLVEKIDVSALSVKPTDFLNPGNLDENGVGYYSLSHNVFWNSDAIKSPMSSWADVFDPSGFPGKRGFLDSGYWVLEEAALAAGATAENLYPIDMDKVFQSLDRVKDSAVFTDFNAITNLVAQQDVVSGDMNLARVRTSVKSGTPLKYVWNQALTDIERLQIAKGAPNRENAMKLIDFVLQPEQQFAIYESLRNSPVTKAAFKKIPKAEYADLAASPVTTPEAVFLNFNWWATDGQAALKQFKKWLLTA